MRVAVLRTPHGELVGTASHPVLVNGVVASGLGDNEALNLAFPRQESWKARQVEMAEVAAVDGA